jgi:uncharacterized protein (DUF1800 family)
MNTPLETALAGHRFGLGEQDLSVVGPDPRAWLIKQIGPADPQQGVALASSLEALHDRPDMLRKTRRGNVGEADQQEAAKRAEMRADMHKARAPKGEYSAHRLKRHLAKEVEKDISISDIHARLLTAATTQRPFAERLAMFWSNHFTVAQPSLKSRGLVGSFEREAIRPHIAGSFQQLLRASTLHPAMLRYLDNQKSIGPNSAAIATVEPGRKGKGSKGLNENLAREVLELHTLGAVSSRTTATPGEHYSQADVTEFARVLTGWAAPETADSTTSVVFDPARHEPGTKTVLGKVYPQGPEALDMVLADLARHPATARFVSTKLARHFVADEPPQALVDRLAGSYLRSNGDLPTLYHELINAPEAWAPQMQKLKTPEEFAVSSARLLRLDPRWLDKHRDGGVELMGQKVQNAPSPAGWGDRMEDWLGPEALWKRIEWVNDVVDRYAGSTDARLLAQRGLGPLLAPETSTQLARAADGRQALTLLLMAPEFQRR